MDLGLILKMMLGGKTPQANDSFGYTHDHEDINGNPLGVRDTNGDAVTDPSLINSYAKQVKSGYNTKTGGYNTLPYKPITGLDAAFNPAPANYVAEQNANYRLAQPLANRQQDIQQNLIGRKYDSIDPSFWPSTSRSASAVLSPDPSATSLLASQRAIASMNAGLPNSEAQFHSTQTQAQIEEANKALEMAKFGMTQIPTEQGTIGNANQLALKRSSGDLNRSDVTEAAENYKAINQLSKAHDLDPAELQAAISEAKTHKLIASMREGMAPDLAGIEKNRIIGERYQSNYLPPPSNPIGSRINQETGAIESGIHIPGYVSMVDAVNAKMPTLGSGMKRERIGNKTFDMPAIAKPIDYRTGQPIGSIPNTSRTNSLVSNPAPPRSNIIGQSPAKPMDTEGFANFQDWLSKQRKLKSLKDAQDERDELVRRGIVPSTQTIGTLGFPQ